MADIMSILSSGYTQAALQTPSKTPYVNVDPATFQGTWTGTYNNGKTYKLQVSNVTGFRAQVKYESAGTVKYQNVLIKDGSFRVGDAKFQLSKAGKPATATSAQTAGTATVKTAISDPVTGQTTLYSGPATQAI
jgi:hypothetical protein